MAGLKTLNDAPAKQDAGTDAPAKQDAGTDAPAKVDVAVDESAANAAQQDGASTSSARADQGAEAAAAPDPALAKLGSELAEAIERGDKLESDFLSQSDKLAAANAALAKAEDQFHEFHTNADTARATIARLEAQVKALGSAPPAPPAEAAIKRPKIGKAIKLPDEGKRAKASDAFAAYEAGALLVVVLADDNGVVQPYPAQIGGQGMFIAGPSPSTLLFAPAIELVPEQQRSEVRHAVLLDPTGKVLSACRLGALLLGGGGLSAMIPGNTLVFAFD